MAIGGGWPAGCPRGAGGCAGGVRLAKAIARGPGRPWWLATERVCVAGALEVLPAVMARVRRRSARRLMSWWQGVWIGLPIGLVAGAMCGM